MPSFSHTEFLSQRFPVSLSSFLSGAFSFPQFFPEAPTVVHKDPREQRKKPTGIHYI